MFIPLCLKTKFLFYFLLILSFLIMNPQSLQIANTQPKQAQRKKKTFPVINDNDFQEMTANGDAQLSTIAETIIHVANTKPIIKNTTSRKKKVQPTVSDLMVSVLPNPAEPTIEAPTEATAKAKRTYKRKPKPDSISTNNESLAETQQPEVTIVVTPEVDVVEDTNSNAEPTMEVPTEAPTEAPTKTKRTYKRKPKPESISTNNESLAEIQQPEATIVVTPEVDVVEDTNSNAEPTMEVPTEAPTEAPTKAKRTYKRKPKTQSISTNNESLAETQEPEAICVAESTHVVETPIVITPEVSVLEDTNSNAEAPTEAPTKAKRTYKRKPKTQSISTNNESLEETQPVAEATIVDTPEVSVLEDTNSNAEVPTEAPTEAPTKAKRTYKRKPKTQSISTNNESLAEIQQPESTIVAEATIEITPEVSVLEDTNSNAEPTMEVPTEAPTEAPTKTKRTYKRKPKTQSISTNNESLAEIQQPESTIVAESTIVDTPEVGLDITNEELPTEAPTKTKRTYKRKPKTVTFITNNESLAETQQPESTIVDTPEVDVVEDTNSNEEPISAEETESPMENRKHEDEDDAWIKAQLKAIHHKREPILATFEDTPAELDEELYIMEEMIKEQAEQNTIPQYSEPEEPLFEQMDNILTNTLEDENYDEIVMVESLLFNGVTYFVDTENRVLDKDTLLHIGMYNPDTVSIMFYATV
jgi:hypothetical protein